jgi:hypothetical protein
MRRTVDFIFQIIQGVAEVARNGLFNAPLIAFLEIPEDFGVFVRRLSHPAGDVEGVEDKPVGLKMKIVQYPDNPRISGGIKDV